MSVSKMVSKLGLACAVLLLASCQTVRGSWYFQKERASALLPEGCDQPSQGCLYVRIFNHLDRAIEADEVEVYTHATSGWRRSEGLGPTWRCSKTKHFAGALAPGRQLLLALPSTGAASCAIPLEAAIVERARDSRVRVKIAASNPSSIPLAWVGCPVLLEPDQKPEDQDRARAALSCESVPQASP